MALDPDELRQSEERRERPARVLVAAGGALAVVAGILTVSVLIGGRQAPSNGLAAPTPGRHETVPVTQSSRAHPSASPSTNPSSDAAAATPSPSHSGVAGCFGLDARATPDPAPRSDSTQNPELIAQLPATLLGDPTTRTVMHGPTALASTFTSSMARGMLTCSGAAADDLWMGWSTGPNGLGYAVLAIEIDGVSGRRLQQIWLDEFIRKMKPDATWSNAAHAERPYLLLDGPSVAYATDRTFFWITAYCCVDPGPSATSLPTATEILDSYLEGLPAS